MRNMSFMLTTEQVRNRTKTVTRRLGWKTTLSGEIIRAVEKCQGLKKGEKIKEICCIIVVNKSLETLNAITREEVIKEGFPDMTPEEFIEMFCRTHRGCTPLTTVTRIEYEYI